MKINRFQVQQCAQNVVCAFFSLRENRNVFSITHVPISFCYFSVVEIEGGLPAICLAYVAWMDGHLVREFGVRPPWWVALEVAACSRVPNGRPSAWNLQRISLLASFPACQGG